MVDLLARIIAHKIGMKSAEWDDNSVGLLLDDILKNLKNVDSDQIEILREELGQHSQHINLYVIDAPNFEFTSIYSQTCEFGSGSVYISDQIT